MTLSMVIKSGSTIEAALRSTGRFMSVSVGKFPTYTCCTREETQGRSDDPAKNALLHLVVSVQQQVLRAMRDGDVEVDLIESGPVERPGAEAPHSRYALQPTMLVIAGGRE